MKTQTQTQTQTSGLESDDCLGSYLNYEMGSGLLFTPSGQARIASIHGYIQGLYECGEGALAIDLLDDITGQLDYLKSYGGDVEGTTIPRYKVVLSDDGTRHGFGVTWWRAVKLSELETSLDDRTESSGSTWYPYITNAQRDNVLGGSLLGSGGHDSNGFGLWQTTSTEYAATIERYIYQYSMNGGLLYHGPNRGEVYAVNVSNKPLLWSIHT